jgi:hypothetical protein
MFSLSLSIQLFTGFVVLISQDPTRNTDLVISMNGNSITGHSRVAAQRPHYAVPFSRKYRFSG